MTELTDQRPPAGGGAASADETTDTRQAFSLTRTLILTFGNVLLVLLILWLTGIAPAHMQWWLQATAGAAPVLFTGLYVSIHLWTHWARPTRRLTELLRQIREGEAPIDELSNVSGGLAPIVAEVKLALQDLRRQRAELAKLEVETSQRVANRTHALERTLGTLQQQASKDALTGLHNRRMLDACLAELIAKARADMTPITIMMIDVDDFKLLNDTLGHAAGDDFLRSLGQLVRSTLRESDLAFRYGGDEFVIVLPQTTADHADTLARRLTSLVDGLTRTLRVGRPPRLSIGMLDASSQPHDASAAAIIAQADRLLYAVKQARKSGRPPRPTARVA